MNLTDPEKVAAELAAELRNLPLRTTASQRAACRVYSRQLKSHPPDFVRAVAGVLLEQHGCRWQAYELIAAHPGAFGRMGVADLERLGRGIDSWWTVDAFARTLSGPAWLRGQVADETIASWARSPDVWWRRAALVSTVALNMRSHGGPGDVPRTLAICHLLVDDHADMVVKAMSWALRELVWCDPQAVEDFLNEHQTVLAARVTREVRHKLATGLKNPRRKRIL